MWFGLFVTVSRNGDDTQQRIHSLIMSEECDIDSRVRTSQGWGVLDHSGTVRSSIERHGLLPMIHRCPDLHPIAPGQESSESLS